MHRCIIYVVYALLLALAVDALADTDTYRCSDDSGWTFPESFCNYSAPTIWVNGTQVAHGGSISVCAGSWVRLQAQGGLDEDAVESLGRVADECGGSCYWQLGPRSCVHYKNNSAASQQAVFAEEVWYAQVPDASRALVEYLDTTRGHAESDVQEYAAQYGPALASDLIDVLGNASVPVKVKARAAYFLGVTGDERGVPVLTALLEKHASPVIGPDESSLFTCALYGLGFIGNDRALTYLESVLRDSKTPWEKTAGIAPQRKLLNGSVVSARATLTSTIWPAAMTALSHRDTPERRVILESLAETAPAQLVRGMAERAIARLDEEKMARETGVPTSGPVRVP